MLYSCASTSAKKTVSRYIPKTCERCLDAPNYVPDYYLNLMDWSSDNIIAVALSDKVYLWNASTAKVTELTRNRNNQNYTSVCWANSKIR